MTNDKKNIIQILPMQWILNILFKNKDKETLIYEFEEYYNHIKDKSGRTKANGWYFIQILKLIKCRICNQLFWSVPMAYNYLKIAFRNIWKYKGYSFINIIGLSVGIACFLLIWLYIQYETSFDRFHENHERIYRLSRHMPGHFHEGKDKMAIAVLGAGPAISDAFPEVGSFVRVNGKWHGKITVDERSFFENGILYADDNFFNFFAFDLIYGNKSEVLADPNTIVISEKMQQKYFGSTNPLGKTIRLNDETDLTVTGVMENMPPNTQFKSDLIISLKTYANLYNQDLNEWRGGAYTFIRLQKDIDPIAFDKKIKPFTEERWGLGSHIKPYLFLQPLANIHLETYLDAEMAPVTDLNTLYIFGTAAILILLVACINYMNLTTSRSAVRMKEVGVRKVTGAQRSQLVHQFLGESFFLTFLAFISAIGIVSIALPLYNRLIERSINPTSLFSYPIGLYILIIFFAVSLLCGTYPAYYLSKLKPLEVLQSRFLQTSKRFNLRAVLVVFQFTVSIILLISTLVVKKQLQYVRDFKMGYSTEQIVVFEINDSGVRNKLNVIKQDLAQLPHIKMVSSSTSLPNSMRSQTLFNWPGKPKDFEVSIYSSFVDYNFVDLFGLEIVEGRNFSKDFSSDQKGAFLINETAARIAGWEHVLGHELMTWGERSGHVVGVLKDFNFHSLHRPIEPLHFYLESQTYNYWLSIKIDGQAIPQTVQQIQTYLQQYPTNYPFEFKFFDDVFDQMYRSEMQLEKIFSLFAGLAILIAVMGLLGLVSFMVARKTKEIGIRKVLGCGVGNLVWSLIRSFLKWVLLANIVAWPVSWIFMKKWLMDFAYRFPLRLELFLFAGFSTLMFAALIIIIQTIRAAKVNPVESLKYE